MEKSANICYLNKIIAPDCEYFPPPIPPILGLKSNLQ